MGTAVNAKRMAKETMGSLMKKFQWADSIERVKKNYFDCRGTRSKSHIITALFKDFTLMLT